MATGKNVIDPQLLQVRWVLGGITAEDLVSQAVLAIKQGFDGTALRQLAGYIKPTAADLRDVPERAFADVGLPPMDREQALDFLVARAATLTDQTICTIVEEFPSFSERWREHLADWRGEPAGRFNDMAAFVHFVVQDLYEKAHFDEVRRAFQLLETLFTKGDEDTQGLIGFGFFETLQCFASWRPYGNEVFEQFLGPMSKQCWQEIERLWEGKSSLMDVIISERERD